MMLIIMFGCGFKKKLAKQSRIAFTIIKTVIRRKVINAFYLMLGCAGGGGG